MRPSSRRTQQFDSSASMATVGEMSKPKWRESASDVDDREEDEDEEDEGENQGEAGHKTVRAAVKAGARRRGSGNRQHLAQAADATNMTARSAYWKLFASREWRQHTAGLAVARRASTDSSCEDSNDDDSRRQRPMDPPSSTEDGSDDGEKREAGDEVVMLREQVALLVQNLEKEKQRRTVEQNLMQSKIIELQGLIRRNLPEQQRALERRLQSRPSPSGSRIRNAVAARSVARALAKSGGPGSSVSHCHHTYHHHHIHHHQARGCSSCETNQNQLPCCEALLERSMSMPTTLDQFPTAHTKSPKSRLSVDVTDNQAMVERVPSPELSPLRVHSKTTPRKSAAVAERMLEASMKKQMGKMRARMTASVAEAERETAALRAQLGKQIKAHDQRERQMRLEFQVQLAAADERQRRTAHKAAQVARQVVQMTEEKQQLAAMVNAQAECIRRLQLAVGGRQIVEHAEKKVSITSTTMPELR